MKIRRILVWCLISLFSGLGAIEHCSPSDTESVLQINNVYTYHFRSVALAQAVGTTEDQSKVVLECQVIISHDRKCHYTMELQDCVITASGGEPGFESSWMDQKPLPDLSRYHVTFSLANGEIKEVKTHEDDPLYYVNIKKGVLSAFVFKLSQTREEVDEMHTDIHGTCPLKSVPDKDAEGEVKTSKDMLHCQFPSRPDWQFSPWSLFWNMSFIQHVINSTTNCSYKVSTAESRIDKVFCHERHAIMLESTHRTTTAVQTNIFYYMDFVKSEVQNAKPVFVELTRTTDIRYEYEDTPVPKTSPQDFLRTAVRMLSDLVLDSVDEIRLFTIPQFTDFVAWIRASHDLTPLVDKVKHCEFVPDGTPCDDRIKELATSYLSDALVQCNSLPCAKAVAHLAKNDDLSPAYVNFVYHTWSYMHYSKPGFITNFVDICQSKDSHQCWMSVGAFARRTYSRDDTLDGKVLQEVKEVANYFHGRIEEDCEVTHDADNSHYTNCLVFLKAASHLGKCYTTLVPGGVSRLLEHATNDHSLTFVRTSALEAIREVYDPDNKEQHREIFDEILPLLKNSSLPVSVRILSYDQLILLVSEEYHFEEDLLGILKEEKNSEVKFYVADSLNALSADWQFRAKQEKFLNSLTELLQENRLSLEVILYETKAKSRSSTQSASLDLPFLPDPLKRFGAKVSESRLFDSFIYPTILNQETITQLFSTLLPTTKMGSYFEGWEELLLAYRKNSADMDSKSVPFSKMYQALAQTLEEYGAEEGEEDTNHFGGSVITNIQKLHRLYWQHHDKLDPYAKTYMDLFGSTLKYMVQDSFRQSSVSQDWARTLRFLWKGLEDGVTYNATRVVRVIEAYHQVPTMMGLPLNWTTHATLAFSVRAGLRYKLNIAQNQIQSKGFVQPSAALTFLNRMVLDFPTLTQIGVQANSSGYTSTHLKLHYDSSKGKQSLRLERPTRTQKVLELFRTNQLIKHTSYNDIVDWDVERTSSSWCTGERTHSAAGLQFCLSRSYPNVTHRLKPWALMAGWCKWQFLVHPADQNDVHYGIELQQTPKQKSKEYNAKFSVTGKEKEKAANFMVVMDTEEGKDMKLELKTSLLPDFHAAITRGEITRNKKVSGQKVEAFLNIFKDFKYKMEYSNEGKLQKPPSSSSKGGTSADESSQIRVHEERFSLSTPYSVYRGNKTILKVGENTKAEAALQYENINSKHNWMKMFLPPGFWENDKKASVKLLLHWKKPIYKSGDTETRQTEFRLIVPHYTMSLLGDSTKMGRREQINVNLAKMNLKYQKLETFLNFTYDWWRNEQEDDPQKDICQVNVTVPRRSWSLTFQKAKETQAPRGDNKYKYEVKIRRILMKPKQESQSNYVGWWSNEVADHFTLQEQEVKLNVDLEMPNSEEVHEQYFTALAEEDSKDLTSSVTVCKASLHYPSSGRVESILLDGYLLVSSGMRTSRFQKTFDLTSSYNNLQLTSNSVYKSGAHSTILYHHSYFTHLPSQTKAYHTINYTRKEPDGECRQIAFKHNIRSHVFDLSTDATYNCPQGTEDLHTLLLKINTNSSKWNMLDMTLDQVVQDLSAEYTREDVSVTHPLGTLHVDAEWQGKTHERKDHQKRVVACSKEGNCPNAEFSLEMFRSGRTNVKFSLPNQNNSQVTYERKMSSDYKNFQIKLGHSNNESSFAEFLNFTGEIVSENFHVWKIVLDVNTFAKVKELVLPAYNSACEAVISVAKDAHHPLNEMLQPALKMTLYDYWNSMKTEAGEFWSVFWLEVKEVLLSTFEAFTQSAYTLLCNSITVVHEFFRMTYDAVKDKSVTIWAINYFHLPYYIQQGFTNLPRGIGELLHQLAVQEEGVLNVKFITGKIVSLSAFNEWPTISFIPSWLKKIIHFETDAVPYSHLSKGEKLGMIFGPQHVYTFDGYLYDVPRYPHEDCSFLLAHDVHKSLFTVFSSQKGIHILFPEMSVSIDEHNEVFINGSQSPTFLPIQAGNGKVTVKRGQSVVEVWSPSLSVLCSDRHFLCLLKLRGFHSGGVIGLLGNADEREDNEFTLPNGNTTSSLLEFVSSFEISGKAECKNLVLNTIPPDTDQHRGACSDEFGDVCYSRYNVREQFMKACLSDIKAGQDLCYAAAGLSALCHFQYAPSHTGCNPARQEGDNIGTHLEVVLVVQESKHLTSPDTANAPVKGMESLVNAIDAKFKESGYGKVRFSLVGFGGNGVHHAPTVHSAGKEIWLPAEDMTKDVLKTLEFKSKENADAVFALKYALDELGYDSFNSKVVIVVTVKDRQVVEKSLTDSIQRHLEENGITLYSFSSYPSIEKGKKVFGVRADGLIFPSQAKGGDAYMDYPRGSLAKLTSSSRGSLFLVKFLRDNKPASFFAEIAQELWAKVNKEAEKCRSCKAVKSEAWWYRKECTIVHC